MKYLLPVILCLCLPFYGFSQNIEQDTLKARQLIDNLPKDEGAAMTQLENAAQIYKKYELEEFYAKVSLYRLDYLGLDDLEQAENLANKIIAEVKSPEAAIVAHHSLSIWYIRRGKGNKALAPCLKALEIYQQNELEDKERLYNIYRQMAKAYNAGDDPISALDYLGKAEAQAQQLKSTKPILLAEAWLEQARTGIYMTEIIQPMKLLDKAIALIKKHYGNKSPKLFDYYFVYGFAYYATKERDKSIAIYKKLLDDLIAYHGTDEVPLIAQVYLNIGGGYKGWNRKGISKAEQKRLKREIYTDSSIYYYNKAAEIHEKLSNGVGASVAFAYLMAGAMYTERLDEHDEAIRHYNKAISALVPEQERFDLLSTPSIAGTGKNVLDYLFLIRVLRYKFLALSKKRKRKDGDAAMLTRKMLDVANELNKLLDDYTQILNDNAQKIVYQKRTGRAKEFTNHFLSKKSHIDNEDVLALLYKMWDKSTNAKLRTILQSSEAGDLGGVNKEVIEQEKKLKKAIGKTQKKLLDAQLSGDSLAVAAMKDSLLALQNRYTVFIQNLSETSPSYHELKYEQAVPELAKVQSQLSDDQLILQYVIRRHNVYLLKISSKETSLAIVCDKDSLRHKKELQEVTKRLRKALTNVQLLKDNPEKAYREYTQHAHRLYQLLGLEGIDNSIKKLIIIPYQELHYIPFEVLLTKPAPQSSNPSYQDLAYLIQEYEISYASSISLWLKGEQNSPKGNKGILGFAASYQAPERWKNLTNRSDEQEKLRMALSDLPGAKKELKNLKESYAGQFFFGEDANEAQFKAVDRNAYAVLHLAMHGLLNPKHSFASSLAFTENGDTTQDNFVYAYELTQMPIQTDLVVLSACETGYGKFSAGEGVASLARSFRYAGTPSLVMTLWEVNDHSTARIMKLFYEGLYHGLNKPEALQQAKTTYLKETKGVGAHPFFWAPYVQLGNTKAIHLPSKNAWWYQMLGFGAGGLGVLLLGGLGWRLKRKKEQRAEPSNA